MRKLGQVALLGLAVSLLGVSQVQPVSAQTKASTVRVVKLTKKTYHVTQSRRAVYTSTKLTRVRTRVKKHTNFKVTKQATVVRKNGKTARYLYVTNAKTKGWIWHRYLKAGKYDWEAVENQKIRRDCLKEINRVRRKKHLKPLTTPKAYQKLADQRAKDIRKLGDNAKDYYYNKNQKSYLEVEAPKYGLDGSQLYEDIITGMPNDGWAYASGFLYDNNGKPSATYSKLISKQTTSFALGIADDANYNTYLKVES